MPKLEKGSDAAKERMSALRALRKPKGVVESVVVPVVEMTPVPFVVPDAPVFVPDAVKPKKTRKMKNVVVNEISV